MTRIYAIGDIHGRLDLLDELLGLIEQDAGDTPYQLVFLGDYVDRGKDSAGVLDRLLELEQKHTAHKPVFLMGNHEYVMRCVVDGDFSSLARWLTKAGGLDNIRSYGVYVPSDEAKYPDMIDAFTCAVKAKGHDELIRRMPLSHQSPTHFFCHAGIDPEVPLPSQTEKSLLMIGKIFLESTKMGEKIVVHGHKISAIPDWRPNRIGVDTGAYDSGMLTAVALDGYDNTRFIVTGGYSEEVTKLATREYRKHQKDYGLTSPA